MGHFWGSDGFLEFDRFSDPSVCKFSRDVKSTPTKSLISRPPTPPFLGVRTPPFFEKTTPKVDVKVKPFAFVCASGIYGKTRKEAKMTLTSVEVSICILCNYIVDF